MEDEKITLDMKAFQTLASDTRIGILKSLDQRRKTLTELSKQSGLSASTVKEHMDKLAGAELVRMVDDGHKWKYYELTRRGSKILHPGTAKIWVMLALSAFGMFYVFWDALRWAQPAMLMRAVGEAGEAAKDMLQAPATEAAQGAGEALAAGTPFVGLIGLAVFSAVFGLAVGMLIHARRHVKI